MEFGQEKSFSSLESLCSEYRANNQISGDLFDKYQVKRGLRNPDGTGVIAGLTNISNVHGYIIEDEERTPDEGKLIYRGIDLRELVDGCTRDDRFGFEEVEWLLLFGHLPTQKQLERFNEILNENRELPEYFAEDMIIKAPSANIMNKLARSVLALYSYDDTPDDPSLENNMRQSVELIARLPTIMTYAYHKSIHPISIWVTKIPANETRRVLRPLLWCRRPFPQWFSASDSVPPGWNWGNPPIPVKSVPAWP